ncbi:uncharacterized protein zgc:193811 [Tachysurus vachellii]|uniref:uncharacterized protein zgc:193811 n=1 Tax=Tachysurus vachellii TaxID=175792 RepID=UPI00296B0FE9|nr:uncharacterized protein zgc:193811 [Tachysurus vachellii]
MDTSRGLDHDPVHPQLLDTHSCKNAPLPPVLQRRAPRAPQYITSYMEHDPKPVDDVLRNVIYPKAAPHWRAHYLSDLAKKLRDSRSVRSVSAPPVSEMKDQYRGRSAPYQPLEPHYRTLQTLHGQLHQPSDLQPEEPAISTTHADYRRFSRSELALLSGSDDSPTHAHLTKSATPPRLLALEAPPSTSSQLQLHRPPVPVPHGGRSSLYMDSIGLPASLPKSCTTSMAALAGTNHNGESELSLLEHVLDVPEMYGTENQTYGKGKIVLV